MLSKGDQDMDETVFPRLKGLGLIEAFFRIAKRTGICLFPRLKGLGLIEACCTRGISPVGERFPRLKGLGLIEAMTNLAACWRAVMISQAERSGPH